MNRHSISCGTLVILMTAFLSTGCGELGPKAVDQPDPAVVTFPGRTLSGELARVTAERARLRSGGPGSRGFSEGVEGTSLTAQASDSVEVQWEHDDPDESELRFKWLYTWLLPHPPDLVEQGAFTEMEPGAWVTKIEHWKEAKMDGTPLPTEYASISGWDMSPLYFLSDRYIQCMGDTPDPPMIEAEAAHKASSFSRSITGLSGPAFYQCENEPH